MELRSTGICGCSRGTCFNLITLCGGIEIVWPSPVDLSSLSLQLLFSVPSLFSSLRSTSTSSIQLFSTVPSAPFFCPYALQYTLFSVPPAPFPLPPVQLSSLSLHQNSLLRPLSPLLCPSSPLFRLIAPFLKAFFSFLKLSSTLTSPFIPLALFSVPPMQLPYSIPRSSSFVQLSPPSLSFSGSSLLLPSSSLLRPFSKL